MEDISEGDVHESRLCDGHESIRGLPKSDILVRHFREAEEAKAIA